MVKIPTRSYTEEFKREAVRLVEDGKQRPAEVARQLSISETALLNWRNATKDWEARVREDGHS